MSITREDYIAVIEVNFPGAIAGTNFSVLSDRDGSNTHLSQDWTVPDSVRPTEPEVLDMYVRWLDAMPEDEQVERNVVGSLNPVVWSALVIRLSTHWARLDPVTQTRYQTLIDDSAALLLNDPEAVSTGGPGP